MRRNRGYLDAVPPGFKLGRYTLWGQNPSEFTGAEAESGTYRPFPTH